MKNNIILLFFLIFLISCNQPVQNNEESKQKTSNGKKDGLVVKYRKDGTLLSEVNYKNGKRHGIAKDYYRNGKIRLELTYANDLKHGKQVWFYENGDIFEICPFTNGMINGIRKFYHERNKIKAEIPYKNNHPGIGLKEYMHNGKLKKKYPKLVIKSMDNRDTEGKYILRISLSDGSEKVKFYRGDLMENKYKGNGIIEIFTMEGIGELIFPAQKGTPINEKVSIIGEFITKDGNPLILHKDYYLKL
ncbi:toxin-antitoxin system YwqK family antitoxin [Bacteroidota bacterium]